MCSSAPVRLVSCASRVFLLPWSCVLPCVWFRSGCVRWFALFWFVFVPRLSRVFPLSRLWFFRLACVVSRVRWCRCVGLLLVGVCFVSVAAALVRCPLVRCCARCGSLGLCLGLLVLCSPLLVCAALVLLAVLFRRSCRVAFARPLSCRSCCVALVSFRFVRSCCVCWFVLFARLSLAVSSCPRRVFLSLSLFLGVAFYYSFPLPIQLP